MEVFRWENHLFQWAIDKPWLCLVPAKWTVESHGKSWKLLRVPWDATMSRLQFPGLLSHPFLLPSGYLT